MTARIVGLLAAVALSFASAGAFAIGAEASMSNDAIKERIKPVGGVCVQTEDCKPVGLAAAAAAGAAGGAPRTGEQVVGAVCSMCHGTGAAGSPKIGDKAAWGPRIAQGEATLVQHALNGFTGKKGMMPPRGTCTTCSDEEIKNAVKYLMSKGK